MRVAYAVLTIFDALPGLDIVKNDILKNCDKVWKRIKDDGDTLQQICDADIEEMNGDVKRAGHTDGTSCNALLWLQRALRLVNAIMEELVRDTKLPLAKCTYNAYGVSLKRHHNFVMKSIFAAAVNLGPSREVFFTLLAPHSTEPEALKVMAKVTPPFAKLLDAVDDYLVARKIETPPGKVPSKALPSPAAVAATEKAAQAKAAKEEKEAAKAQRAAERAASKAVKAEAKAAEKAAKVAAKKEVKAKKKKGVVARKAESRG